MVVGGTPSRIRFVCMAIEYRKLVCVICKKELEAIEVTQVYIMISVAGIIQTHNNRSYQVSFRCNTRCISKYRVRDGVRDCYPNEEVSYVNNSCPQIQRHRLQCSSSELSCLLASNLGNWGSACSNNRDEFDQESGTVFFNNLKCERRDDVGCVYSRNYIRISSFNNTNKTIIATNSILDDLSTIIPFRSYCNSFFDTIAGTDELPDFCKQWACLSDQYQCVSGQCISQSWVCDG